MAHEFKKSGRKYPFAAALDENGQPIAHELYEPKDKPARPIGCTSCGAAFELVQRAGRLGTTQKGLYFRTKGGLSEHFSRGCTYDHTQNDRDGSARSILDFVSKPAGPGKRKILYLNMKVEGADYAPEETLPGLKQMQMRRPVDTATGVFPSARGPDDVASWRAKTGSELAHIAFHPKAHEGLIDEVDVINDFHRFPLRRIVGELSEIYASEVEQRTANLNYPALSLAQIEPDQIAALSSGAAQVVSHVYGKGDSMYQLVVEAEGPEKEKIAALLNKGGAYTLYGDFKALDERGFEYMAGRLEGNDVFVPMDSLKLLRLSVRRTADVLRYSPARAAQLGLD